SQHAPRKHISHGDRIGCWKHPRGSGAPLSESELVGSKLVSSPKAVVLVSSPVLVEVSVVEASPVVVRSGTVDSLSSTPCPNDTSGEHPNAAQSAAPSHHGCGAERIATAFRRIRERCRTAGNASRR